LWVIFAIRVCTDTHLRNIDHLGTFGILLSIYYAGIHLF